MSNTIDWDELFSLKEEIYDENKEEYENALNKSACENALSRIDFSWFGEGHSTDVYIAPVVLRTCKLFIEHGRSDLINNIDVYEVVQELKKFNEVIKMYDNIMKPTENFDSTAELLTVLARHCFSLTLEKSKIKS